MKTVILFDFDQSLIDCNSDPWVVEKLGASDLMASLSRQLSWTCLMDTMMGEVHKQGKTIENIEACLNTIVVSPHIISAIQSSHSLGCDLQIISDANSFFIKTILEKHGLLNYFSKIHTNPAVITDDGRLRIFPFNAEPHGCNRCPLNMCKGLILDGIQRHYNQDARRQYVYIGDGKGDFCPSLRLGTEDHVLARQDFPLWKLLCKHSNQVKAQVHGWNTAKDVADYLVHIQSI